MMLLMVVLSAGCQRNQQVDVQQYQPERALSAVQQRQFIESIVRYYTKLAPEANHENKFNPEFDWYYNRAIDESQLWAYHQNPDSSVYFLVARKARSITPMKEGIAGQVKVDARGNMIVYKEVFRTWKMTEDSLKIKGLFLFDKMVHGEDLMPYTPPVTGDRYIEFPDGRRFFFDEAARRWRDRELDTLNFSGN